MGKWKCAGPRASRRAASVDDASGSSAGTCRSVGRMQLARTSSAHERATSRAAIAEAERLDAHTAAMVKELSAVRSEMLAVRTSVVNPRSSLRLLSAQDELPLGRDDFPDEVLVNICCFLGLRELGRLACVAQRFTRPTLPEPGKGGSAKLSPIEESVRVRMVAASSARVLEQRVGETWMRALWRNEYRLAFTACASHDAEDMLALSDEVALLGGDLVVGALGAVATSTSQTSYGTVCTKHPMVVGIHYAELTLLSQGELGQGQAFIGLVGQHFNAASGDRAQNSVDNWLLCTLTGNLQAGPGRPGVNGESPWQGQPGYLELKPGDAIGFLLDLGQCTLTVYINGARRGIMAAAGFHNTLGDVVPPLAGPLRWAADVYGGASVRIDHRVPPPSPTTDEVAMAIVWNEQHCRPYQTSDDDY